MQNAKELSPGIWVSPQITRDDIKLASEQGIRTIISARSDGEEPGQEATASLKKTAEEHGLSFHHIPTRPGQYPEEAVAAFANAANEANRPVLAFCKSGMRAAALWALGEAASCPSGQIIEAAGNVGINLEPLQSELDTRRK